MVFFVVPEIRALAAVRGRRGKQHAIAISESVHRFGARFENRIVALVPGKQNRKTRQKYALRNNGTDLCKCLGIRDNHARRLL